MEEKKWVEITRLPKIEGLTAFGGAPLVRKSDLDAAKMTDEEAFHELETTGVATGAGAKPRKWVDMSCTILQFYHVAGISNGTAVPFSELEKVYMTDSEVLRGLKMAQIDPIPAMKDPGNATKVGKIEVASAFVEPKNGVPGLSEEEEKRYSEGDSDNFGPREEPHLKEKKEEKRAEKGNIEQNNA